MSSAEILGAAGGKTLWPAPVGRSRGGGWRVCGADAGRPGLLSATLTWLPAGAGPEGRHPERTVRSGLADGTRATADLDPGLPSPHGCELLMAVALGELLAPSIYAEPWRQPATGIAGLASRWLERGDVTPLGSQLIDCLKHQGILPGTTGR